MSKSEVDIMNDATKVLLDSQKGYEKAVDIVDDNASLKGQLAARGRHRAALVGRFQAHVRALGDEPATEGSAVGSVHRAMTEFTSMFRSDAKAALDAIEDGEEHLVSSLQDKLEEENLSASSRTLLQEAITQAKQGENFADALEDRVS